MASPNYTNYVRKNRHPARPYNPIEDAGNVEVANCYGQPNTSGWVIFDPLDWDAPGVYIDATDFGRYFERE